MEIIKQPNSRQRGEGKKATAAKRRKAVKESQLSLRESILLSFDKVGGVDYLTVQAHENPVAYMGLLKAVIPKEVDIKSDNVNIVELMADMANRLPV